MCLLSQSGMNHFTRTTSLRKFRAPRLPYTIMTSRLVLHFGLNYTRIRSISSKVLLVYIRRTWIIEIASQAIFASAPTSFTISLGHTKETTRKAAHANEIITSSPGFTIKKLTTAELWASPPMLPQHKNVHLIVLTHGLHSNLTADMLYMKERIEKTAGLANRPDGGVVIRGYRGNVCKTERGIKYLGRRMARWLLQETLWLDQVGCFAPEAPPYSRISFIGHSLGGVVQNFAIAMIESMTQGEFFRKLRPVHLITLASPWLGVSAENPAYVKVALDMGLIGRTGQDLGLMNRLGQRFETVPDQKLIRDSRPILRLLALPGSPAHRIVKRFCTRTIYANVINDGIVPLRTSAMFFLDWNSFDTVQKSVAQNGVITHIGNLPGIVGLPTLDNFIGGVERIFSPRKSDSDDSKTSNEKSSSADPQSSNEESGQRPQMFSMPSFLRRKSSHAVPMVKSAEQKQFEEGRRQSMPLLGGNLFDVENEVSKSPQEHMDAGNGKPSITVNTDVKSDDLRRDLNIWNEERRGDEPEDVLNLASRRTKQIPEARKFSDSFAKQSLPEDHPGDIQTSRSRKDKHVSYTDQTYRTTSSMANAEAAAGSISSSELISQRSVSNSSENSSTDKSCSMSSEDIQNTNAPPVDHKSSEAPPSQPHATAATGPPKNEEQTQGDTSGNPLFSFFQHLRPQAGKQSTIPHKISKAYRRSQTINNSPTDPRPPPPKTTFLESFPSLINPPLPDSKFITQPSSRGKTIFHDRLYTPDDIPPVSPGTADSASGTEEQTTKREKLRLEEKIARDWHSDMTWRKVLVKLEPDAHNNIIVRRMFPNAYGWPVIEHLVREHFVKDPEGLMSEFPQESGIIPFVDGASSPSWESSMMDLETDEDDLEKSLISSERPASVGRALMSDEEGNEVLEMTDWVQRANLSNEATNNQTEKNM
jgi:hypothetical protein